MNLEQPYAVVREEGASPQVPHTIRPGDVLADRYRLVDLLAESGGGRFWRAHDQTLERHVALHVVAADDEHAADMMAAARRSAAVVDRRILRVLDVDERDGLCYVVNEWGSGTSLDHLVATEGPVTARRAAWIVSEVAASTAAAHEAGIAHGRLVPENVLIDDTGSVRVIGFSVESALLGLPPGRISSDVTDLAALLYFLLTGRWPGVSRSAVPPAPHEGGRVLRPRQVKAGVPRVLDTLCDQVLNPFATGAGDTEPVDARRIREVLRLFVGDPSGMAAAEAAARRHGGVGTEPRVLPSIATRPAPSPAPVPEAPETAEARAEQEPPAEEEESPAAVEDSPAVEEESPSAELPTQAGMPIFDDVSDDVSWLAARAEKPPPPPAFEAPAERPLFAPEPPAGEPLRRPRARATSDTGSDYWPWESGTGSGVLPVTEEEVDDEVPGRSWLRLAAALGAATLLLLGVVFAFNLGRGRSPLGEVPVEESPTAPSTSASTVQPVTGVTADDLDPQGSPPEENSDLTVLAVDGDPATAWRTVTYEQDLGPAGLKTGVGLALDLGGPVDVAGLDLLLEGSPTEVSIYVTERAPRAVRGLTPAATTTADGGRTKVGIEGAVTGRFVVVWLTSLPAIESGFRGEVAEVVVRGTTR